VLLNAFEGVRAKEMVELCLPGSKDVRVTLRRSGRARRLSLRVSRLDGRVTLTAPARLPERECTAFLLEKANWVRTALETVPQARTLAGAETLPFEGRDIPILDGQGRACRMTDAGLEVPVNRRAAALKAYLKEAARAKLVPAAERYAAALGKTPKAIQLRDTRSRWGSCTSEGKLMFSWRLIMAPPNVLEYVAAHEAAHLVEMNHSPAYWATVERIFPNYRDPRAWLKREGATLHRFVITD